MPNESQIDRIEQQLDDIARLGGKAERTAIFTNVTVIDANPAGLANRVIIQDPRDGDYIPALTIPGIVYNNNDLVNVLFLEGTEPLAFQQGSGSSTATGLWQLEGGTGPDIYYDQGNVAISDDLEHHGDADTLLSFTDDLVELQAGGVVMVRLTETTQDVLALGDVAGTGDVDVNINNGQVFVEGSSGKVGIGTIAIPHGGIGAAMLALEGAGGSTSGPHIQATTATDDYPLWQFLAFTHDNIDLSFDAYFDGSFRSSDAGSNYMIRKLSDTFGIYYSSGVAQGSVVTFVAGLRLNTSGNVQVANDIFRFIDTDRLGLSGGNSIANGANIELYGGTHATLANRAFYDATLHTFRSQDGTSTKLTIDHTANVSRFFHRVGIGASPATSAVLELASTTAALLLTRMTTTQRDALTAVDGMILYNTTTGKIEGREGGAWVDI